MDLSKAKEYVKELSRQYDIDKTTVVGYLTSTIETVLKKRLVKKGVVADDLVEARYEDGDLSIYLFKTIVENVSNPEIELAMDQVQELTEDAYELGDQIGVLWDIGKLSRNEIMIVRQILIQKVTTDLKQQTLDAYKDKEGKLVSGIVRNVSGDNIIIDLGKTDAILAKRDWVRGEHLEPKDKVVTYVKKVGAGKRGKDILVSRNTPLLVAELMKKEIPEIEEGLIEIKAIARIAGQKTKVVVESHDSEIDPLITCVGTNGYKIKQILDELDGDKSISQERETLDIITYNESLEYLTSKLLSPAEVRSVVPHEEGIDVVIEDAFVGKAIGRKGVNIRLASTLLQQNLRIVSYEKLDEYLSSLKAIFEEAGLSNIESVMVVQNGVNTIDDFMSLDVATMTEILGTEFTKDLDAIKSKVKDGVPLNIEDIYVADARPMKPVRLKSHEDTEDTVDRAAQIREELNLLK